MKCVHCGSEKGYYSDIIGTQYYSANGEENGYVIESSSEPTKVHCLSCGRKISFDKIKNYKKGGEENGS